MLQDGVGASVNFERQLSFRQLWGYAVMVGACVAIAQLSEVSGQQTSRIPRLSDVFVVAVASATVHWYGLRYLVLFDETLTLVVVLLLTAVWTVVGLFVSKAALVVRAMQILAVPVAFLAAYRVWHSAVGSRFRFVYWIGITAIVGLFLLFLGLLPGL